VGSLSTSLLVLVFAGGAAATWAAGIFLSNATDALDVRYGLGDALGGIILLAVAGTLPEIAITVSAAASGHLDLAVGNLIGGVAVQTLVLVILDAASGKERPLSFLVGSLLPVIEALIVMAVLGTALGGAALPASTNLFGASPTSYAAVLIWLIGVWIINRARKQTIWRVETPAGATPGRRHHRAGDTHPYPGRTNAAVIGVFSLAAVVTLVAGVLLQDSGNVLAGRLGLTGAVFGATVLAVASALPEISSGIAAVRLGDMQLAVGDIFGGNSFQITLLLLADLIAGTPVIVAAHSSDVWLGAAGMLMTAIAAMGIIARPTRTFLALGADSIALVAVYALAVYFLPK